MKSLREYIQEAKEQHIAIPHFNIAELVTLRAIVSVARETNIPIVIGTSEGEREFIGVDQAVALVKSYQAEGVPVFLNADHTHSVEAIEVAAKAGYDAVLFDGGKLSKEDNIAQTKEAVRRARAANPNVVIEGELGYIGSSSEVLTAIPEGAALTPDLLTSPTEAQEFAAMTGIDLLAPAVGNIHGMLATVPNPHLDIERIQQISEVTQLPLVLQGGSGTPEEDFLKAIQAGVSIVHISTELRVAWPKGIETGLRLHQQEVAPYKLLQEAEKDITDIIRTRTLMFYKK